MSIARPVYVLEVDDPDRLSIVLVIRAGHDGVTRGTVILPPWQELPAYYDGPHEVPLAIRLADDYADKYGYAAIAVDIESSQMWDPAWGALVTGTVEL